MVVSSKLVSASQCSKAVHLPCCQPVGCQILAYPPAAPCKVIATAAPEKLRAGRAGVESGRFGFVEVAECTAVQVRPRGHESRWNLDGELLADNRLTARVHRGLVSVFARGVE